MNNHRNVSVPDICVKELLRHPAYAYVLVIKNPTKNISFASFGVIFHCLE